MLFFNVSAMAWCFVVVGLAAAPLSRHPRMSEEDHQSLQLLLTFIRNMVSIPDHHHQQAQQQHPAACRCDRVACSGFCVFWHFLAFFCKIR
jgi:hypothetical protein